MKCGACGKVFASERAFSGHKAHCGRQKVSCPICHRKLNPSNLGQHLRGHEKDTECLVCRKAASGGKIFCSQSCAAVYNNKKTPKRKVCMKNCLSCGEPIENRGNKYCSACIHKGEHLGRKNNPKEILSGGALRRYLLRTRPHVCSQCGLMEWQGQPVPLEVHHKDGNASDNAEANLVLFCPNCHALEPTSKGKNRGRGRASLGLRI